FPTRRSSDLPRAVLRRRARLSRGRPTDARPALRARGSEPARVPLPQRDRALALRRPADRPAVGASGPAQARAPLVPGRGGHEGVAPPRLGMCAHGEARLALVLGAECRGHARAAGAGLVARRTSQERAISSTQASGSASPWG